MRNNNTKTTAALQSTHLRAAGVLLHLKGAITNVNAISVNDPTAYPEEEGMH